MNRPKYVLIALALAVAALVAAPYVFLGDESRIRKAFGQASALMAKETGEGKVTMARKAQKMGDLAFEKCRMQTGIDLLTGTFNPSEITSLAAQFRMEFKSLSLLFQNIEIRFPSDGAAEADLTATLAGEHKNGEAFSETRDMRCRLKKAGRKWLFTDVEVVPVTLDEGE